ncbi:ectoine/hydroxyectoine ABC transporter permease subunit EhuD [Paenibacillus sp. SYP-B4298]|uniref:ectoine/hydroxyectoine ABC transporter permease subunit EhuD n=1 Tax=Paenibacillus sp. SYP-B4298 TaxID=2996034 RepID=UPI0022DDC5FD|nr:ectoine/hydroxyectoine ABC transporter permease subunit EhuD [Paenibacillus sp. SYP-B4298]
MWDWSYALSILPKLLSALQVTIVATLASFAVACALGLILAMLARSRYAAIRMSINGISEFIRRTPLLVQIFFLFYSIPLLTGISLPALTVGIIGLGLHYSTYLSQVYRSGIDNIDAGQWEAARALNFTPSRTWTSVILPQALPPIIPIMGNYLIVMFKETPLLAAITVVELLTTAKNINARDWRPFEPYTLVGILFLIISMAVAVLVGLLEQRMKRRYSR